MYTLIENVIITSVWINRLNCKPLVSVKTHEDQFRMTGREENGEMKNYVCQSCMSASRTGSLVFTNDLTANKRSGMNSEDVESFEMDKLILNKNPTEHVFHMLKLTPKDNAPGICRN